MPAAALFPLSYAVHLGEEAWGGESFPVWASRLSGVTFSWTEFVVLNAVAFAAMCVAAVAVWRLPRLERLVLPALGTIVAANGTLHAIASLVSSTYSPGVISGTLLWLPLGVWTLRWAASTVTARELAAGSAAGLLAHAAVSAVALID